MDLTKGMTAKDRDDPVQMFPRECACAVLYLREAKARAVGGFAVSAPPLHSAFGSNVEVCVWSSGGAAG